MAALSNAKALNRLAQTTNLLIQNAAADEEAEDLNTVELDGLFDGDELSEVEKALRSGKIKDAMEGAEYKVSDHVSQVLQLLVLSIQTLNRLLCDCSSRARCRISRARKS